MLLLHANEPISSERLALALWGDDAPGESVKTVRVHMSRLRKALGDPAVVATTAGGYRLRVRPGELDADCFEDLTEQGRAALDGGRPEHAATLLREALALWYGSALADLADEPFAAGEIARLEDRRLAALQLRLAADLECGATDALAAELSSHVSAHPTRERFTGLLMLALYRCGRQAEALDLFMQARQRLVAELGVEPGPELRRLQDAILQQDPSLETRHRARVAPLGAAVLLDGRDQDNSPVGCPFKGLAAFDVADAAFFYGRERLVTRLTDAMRDAPVLGVVGPSGSGKSSLVRAGLLPALAEGALPGSERWLQILIRPGEHPSSELHEAMLGRDDRHVLVTVDQFEETFTACADAHERSAFVEALVAASHDRDRRCTVVLVVRADFYGHCAVYPELADLLAANHVLVGPMREEELRRAIEGPSRRAGLQVDAELSDALVHDVAGEPGALPLLSTALLELWHRREGRRLTRDAYTRTGGVRGAVARLADEAFGQLRPDQQRIAPGVLLRLVSEGEDGRVERRRVPLSELESLPGTAVGSILALLTDRRLLTVGSGTVELAHEALLREWPRLNAWIEHDRHGLRVLRNLGAAAHEWRRVGRDDGALYRGATLAAASEWEAEHAEQLSDVEREFLSASQALAHRDIEAARRRTRRLRSLAAGLAALSLIAVVLAAAALDQRDRAQRQRSDARRSATDATSLALAASATAQLPTRPDVSLLLALEANRSRARPEARSSAVAALTAAVDPGILAIMHGHSDAVTGVAFSRDGRLMASASWDRSIRLWDPRTHRQLGTPLLGHTDRIDSVAFARDGRTLVSGGWDGTIRFWDVRTHRQVGALSQGAAVQALAFSPDGRILATLDVGRRVRLWDAHTHRQLGAPLTSPTGAVVAVAFSRDGRMLATAGGGTIRLWSMRTFRQISAPLHAPSSILGIAYGRGDHILAAGAADGKIRLWDPTTREPLGALDTGPTPVKDVAFSPDGRRLASASADNIGLWNVRKRRLLRTLSGHTDSIEALAFSPGGRRLASASQDKTLRLWDPRAPARFGARMAGRTGVVSRMALAADGDTLAATSDRNSVRLWSLRARRQLTWPLTEHSGIGSIGFLRDGRLLALGGARSWTWDVRRAHRPLARPQPRLARWSDGLPLSPDGLTVASVGRSGTIRLRDRRTGAQVGRPLSGPDEFVALTMFSPDGRWLAGATDDGTIWLWDLRDRRRRGTRLIGHAGFVGTLAFSPDSRMLASGGDDRTIRFWDMRAHRQIGEPLTGHTDVLSAVAFSPDAHTLASVAGADRTIRLWDAHSHEPLGAPLPVASEFVDSVTFGRDGRTLVAGTNHSIVLWENLLWNNVAQLRDEVCKLVASGLSRTEWSRYAPGIPYHRSCP
ncbi:MAG: hypothetical protein QOJ35_2983 [Solirubrobacteraceae bacterium]|nr:hypothetical protein [Solirubrobacteraceae bacterium]